MSEVFNLTAWRTALVSSINEFATTLAIYLPRILGAILILAIGWILSKILEALSHKVLQRMGLDRAVERAGLSNGLLQIGWRKGASVLVGKGVFWIVMLTFVITAVESLGLRGVLPTIDRLVAYILNAIAAALVLLLAILGGSLAGSLVQSGASAAGFSYANRLGAATRFLVITLGVVLALEQLGFSTQILVATMTTLVATFGLSMGLALALGSRGVIGHILAGHYLRQSMSTGQSVAVAGRRGTLERVGAVDTLFREKEGSWTIPNSRLLEEIVER